MKNWKHWAFAAMVAIVGIAIIGCKGDETTDKPTQIKREFTITGFAKPITIKDMRTGTNDTDLQTLGVISRLTAGLQVQSSTEFNRAIGFGLTIEVEDTTEYIRLKAYSGNRMGVNITYVLSDDLVFSGRMDSAFAVMAERKPDGAPEDTPRTLSFGTAENPCTVTIKSDDQFTADEWTTLCDKVVAAIERGYEKSGAGFNAVFASSQNAKMVLGKEFTYNWEVKDGEFKTVYLKIASIDTVDFTDIIMYMEVNYPGKDPE